jgi:hypothetical protein
MIDPLDIKDINFAPETINKVKIAIEQEEIALPVLIHIDDIEEPSDKSLKEQRDAIIKKNAELLTNFFIKLHDLFNWDLYEDNRGIGNVNSLQHYSKLTSRWISGQRLSRIILARIQHYVLTGTKYDLFQRDKIPFNNSPSDKNEVIMEVLNELETTLKFCLSNYVTKFVELFKRVKGTTIAVTVADYIDYGTMNDTIIAFQKAGLSRELSKEIYQHNLFSFNDGTYSISNYDKLLRTTKYAEELTLAKKNLRGLFNE